MLDRRVAAATVLTVLAGCVAPPHPAPVISRDQSTSEPAARAAPHSAVYEVVWIAPNGRQTTVPHTTAYLHKGEALGFRTDDQKRLLAVGGEYEFDVTPQSPAMKVAWSRAGGHHAKRDDPSPKDPADQRRDLPEDLRAKPDAGVLDVFVNDPREFHHH